MTADPWKGVFIRRCTRCLEWQPIEEFVGLGKLCKACVPTEGNIKPADTIARARGMAITEQGRADLARWRAEETPAVA